MVGLVLAIPIGALLVLLGAGGSILMMPALVYGAQLDVHQAAGTSLFIVGMVAAAGVAMQRGAVDVRMTLLVGGGGIAGAWAGAWLNHQAPEVAVLAAFAVTLLVAAFGMARPGRVPAHAPAHAPAKALACGVGLGVATGFFGVGGGFLIVPALMLCLGMEARTAVATSLAIIAINSLGGLVGHAVYGAVQWRLGAAFAGAALVGAGAAVPMATHLRASVVQRAFAGLLGVVGIGMLVHVVAGVVS
jgi:uncharacterized membrane protein YfcA